MKDLLVQIGLDSALKDRLEGMTDRQWMSLEKRVYATIRTCLEDEVLFDILKERSPRDLWSRLHILYTGKNMYNKLILKKQLYNLRI